jgi:Tol biopolymer transport system component
VAFSPDSRLLATGNGDRTIQFWTVPPDEPGRETRVLAGHGGAVSSVAFTPDGKQLASASQDGTARVWDVATGKQIAVLKGHEGAVEHVAVSPDGKLLATAGWDRTVRLWDAATGREVRRLTGHTQNALCATFAPDGRTLASSSGRWGDGNFNPGPGEIMLWDLATGKVLAVLRGHTDRVFAVAFSPDGKRLASASWDGTVKVWSRAGRAAEGRAPGGGGDLVADRLDLLLHQLLKDNRTDEQVAEALYLATLGRLPTDGEKARFGKLQQGRRVGRQEAFEELLAALTASPEFQANLESLQRRAAGRPGGQ